MQKDITRKIPDDIFSILKSSIIDVCRDVRVELYFMSFYSQLDRSLNHENSEGTSIRKQIENLTSSEVGRERFFEHYRKVCLSSSRTIGPKCIGVLGSMIFMDGREASDYEENVFEALSTLNDKELLVFVEFWRATRKVHQTYNNIESGTINYGKGFPYQYFKKENRFEVIVSKDDRSEDEGSREYANSPTTVTEFFGKWGKKLENLGIIYKEQSIEVKWSGSGVVAQNKVNFDFATCNLLCSLIEFVDSDTEKKDSFSSYFCI